MPPLQPGALIALMGAGAYGFSMSSNYNSRPRVAEVLVKGEEFFIIREREDYADLVKGERIPTFLEG
jgi:diaminopimelate decarboxylase